MPERRTGLPLQSGHREVFSDPTVPEVTSDVGRVCSLVVWVAVFLVVAAALAVGERLLGA